MEIGGWDYVFFSDKKIEDVLPAFMESIKERWKEPFIEDLSCCKKDGDDTIDLVFSKDEATSKGFKEFDNSINGKSEESFSFMASRYHNFSAFMLVTEIDYAGKKYDREEGYPVFTSFSQLFQYTLVLPESIEDNEFSSFVYGTLTKVLSSA